PCLCLSQSERQKGMVIQDFGETFKVPDNDIKIDSSVTFKVIFDISSSSKERDVLNKQIETAARFLNMHTAEGMEPEQLKVAMTIHGGAWQDVLTDEAYKEKFGTENPNTPLLNALAKANVDIILCGQTAGARGMSPEDVNPNILKALSAMTALLQYQNMGYKFIKF
ncbi:MAG: DsrE family protein, partial [Flavobacteriaceae bacterium]|nr:DsrE family protein [Flavobacteriaceae bacterium]